MVPGVRGVVGPRHEGGVAGSGVRSTPMQHMLGAGPLHMLAELGLTTCVYYTVIWLYFALKIFRTLLFRSFTFVCSPQAYIYKTRVKISLLTNIRTFNFHTDSSV